MAAIVPTILGPDAPCGLRARRDSNAATAVADYRCPCGEAESAMGVPEVQALVARWDAHQANDCPIPSVRAAARSRAARRANPKGSR